MSHLVLFEFRAIIVAHTTTLPHVVKGSREAIEEFIPLREFPALFGGYARWAAPEEPWPEMPGEALGVWGLRPAGKLRRILRERGARLRREPYPGPMQRLSVVHQGWTWDERFHEW